MAGRRRTGGAGPWAAALLALSSSGCVRRLPRPDVAEVVVLAVAAEPAPAPGPETAPEPAAPPEPAASPEPAPSPAPAPAPAPAPEEPAGPAAVPAAGEAPSPAVAPPPASPPGEPPLPPLTSEEWWARAIGAGRPPTSWYPRPCVDPWSGDVTLRLRARATDDDEDVDLYQYVRVRHRREDAPGWSASMHVRISEDLDGSHDGSSFFVFDSVDDTYDSPVLSRLYHLYANWRSEAGFVEQVRIGRQDVTAGEVFHVDGVHALFRGPCEGHVFAFAGIPSHLYESSIEGDWIVGAGASFSPWRGSVVDVSDVYVEDESNYYGTPNANLATLEATQRVGAAGLARAGAQLLDADLRQAWGSADLAIARWDATVRGSVRVQPLKEREQAYDVDPYFAILLDLEPYWEATLSASKGLGPVTSVEAGVHVRRLVDADDEGDFNHDFTRAWATASRRLGRCRDVGVSVTGEWWASEDGEETSAAGFEVDWKPSARWRARAGMDYALYRTDLYAAEERYDSYGWYVRATWRPGTRWEGDAALRLDTDDLDSYVTLQLAVRWEF